jgi:hypothetical protein
VTASSCRMRRSAISPLRSATLYWASTSRASAVVVLRASSDRRPHEPCSRWRNSNFARLCLSSAYARGHVKITKRGKDQTISVHLARRTWPAGRILSCRVDNAEDKVWHPA